MSDPRNPRQSEFIRKQIDLWVPKPRQLPARRRCSFDLPVSLADRFRSVCALQGHRMRDVAQVLVEAYVSQHDEVVGKQAA